MRKKITTFLIALPFLIVGALALSAATDVDQIPQEFPGEVQIISLDQSGDNLVGFVTLDEGEDISD